MIIAVDKNIIFGEEAFSTLGRVVLHDGRKINRADLTTTDALIVRSVTKVNSKLLENTPVKFVATGTIGTDHLDKKYLDSVGIEYFSAPGCNSTSVTEYVLSLLSLMAIRQNFKLAEKSIGIIGVGNIGSKLAKSAEILGMKVVLNDPPRQERENNHIFSSLEAALQCDIVSFHTPITHEGKYKTFHLLNEDNLSLLKPGAILINASRGGVTGNKALLKRLSAKNDFTLALDVWENEPDISEELLELSEIATPHIAGYSLEGKVNGTYTCYKNLCEFLKIESEWKPNVPAIPDNSIDTTGLSTEKALYKIFNRIYNIDEDDRALRGKKGNVRSRFDLLRKNYRARRESKAYNIISDEKVISELFTYLKEI